MLNPTRITVTEHLTIGGYNIPVIILPPEYAGGDVILALVNPDHTGVALDTEGNITPYTLPPMLFIDHPESHDEID